MAKSFSVLLSWGVGWLPSGLIWVRELAFHCLIGHVGMGICLAEYSTGCKEYKQGGKEGGRAYSLSIEALDGRKRGEWHTL